MSFGQVLFQLINDWIAFFATGNQKILGRLTELVVIVSFGTYVIGQIDSNVCTLSHVRSANDVRNASDVRINTGGHCATSVTGWE
jgi:hypothetical protein